VSENTGQEQDRPGLISVRYEDRDEGGRVAYVTVCNEAKLNALPVEGRAELAQVMRKLAEDEALRCVVLTGAGE
jgi:enoyl-CoA hydratase/carnithine racemase